MPSFVLVIGNYNYSSWSLRPWLAMTQAGLNFTEVRIALGTPNTRAQILQYSPTGKVPLLQHGSVTVWESLAICEYLAEVCPGFPGYPLDLHARAVARAIAAEMHAGFQSLRQQLPMDCRARHAHWAYSPETQRDIDRIADIWRTCRQQFGSSGAFLFGDFGIADAMFAPVVSRFVTYGITLGETETAYMDAIWNLPAFQTWLQAAESESETLVL